MNSQGVIAIKNREVNNDDIRRVIDVEKGKRFILPNSRVMIHQPSGGARGMASDIEIQAREILRLRQRMNQHYANYTGKKLEEIEKAVDRDTWLDAGEAKEFGLVDKVFESRPASDADASGRGDEHGTP